MMKKNFAFQLLLLAFFAGCSKGPKPIRYGSEECVFCKMTIMDPLFGCQLVNSKTKTYSFDDIACLTAYLQSGALKAGDIAGIYVSDYTGGHLLMPAASMHFVKSEMFHSPMAGNAAAFSERDSAQFYAGKYRGELLTWQQLNKAHE